MINRLSGSARALTLTAAALALWHDAPKAQISDAFLREHSAILATGEPALELTKDGPVTHVETAIVIKASQKQIWDILVACEIAPEYVPNVIACQSIEVLDDGAAELFIQTVKPAFFIPAFEHVFRMDYYPFERISISRVSGPIRRIESNWDLLPRDDGTVLLTYFLSLDPGIPIPRIFVRQTLRRDLPIVLSAVQQRATAASAAH